MRAPTVHLNGTSKAALLEGVENAYAAVRPLLVAIGEMAPNARDYYVQDSMAYGQASDDYARIQRMVSDLAKELADLHAAIEDQSGGSHGR